MIHTSPTLVIAGSVRPRRISPQIAQWIATLGRSQNDDTFEVVDLRDWPLPMDDEAEMPQRASYASALTLEWSRKIASAAAFIFVTPQYNWGYPAALKNAIDHLYREWADKPVMIVSYGGHGGGKAAAQLQEVCEGIGMRPIAARPALRLSRTQIEANSGEIDPAEAFAGHIEDVRAALAELSHSRNATTQPTAA